MDKKLLSVLIFGIFAISLANILLSIGIVSLLLVNGFSGGGQPSGSTTDALALPGANSTIPVSGMSDQLLIGDAGRLNNSTNSTIASAVSPANNTSVAKPASGDMPLDAGQVPSGSMPAMPDGSQMPSGGQMPSGSMPSGGQPPSGMSGQMPSDTSQGNTSSMPATSSTSLDSSAVGQYPSTTGQMSGDELISSLLQQSGMQGISTGSTPAATTSPGTTSWVFNGSLPFGNS